METQFIKLGDEHINVTEIVKVHTISPYYSGDMCDYKVYLKNNSVITVPRLDNATFARWLSTKAFV